MPAPWEGDERISIDAESLDLDIELSDGTTPPTPCARPETQGWIGRADQTGQVVAYVDATVLQRLLTHALSVTDREVGGLLVGQVLESGGTYVKITGAIAMQHGVEARARLTFTHESWQYMLGVMAREHPNTVIVGWYHTHPGYGIFLSEYDTYIHRNFFDRPHQVAVVVDPLARTIGLFRWYGGSLKKCDGIPVIGDAAALQQCLRQMHRPIALDIPLPPVQVLSLPDAPTVSEPPVTGYQEDTLDVIARNVESGLNSLGQELGQAIEPLASEIDRAIGNLPPARPAHGTDGRSGE